MSPALPATYLLVAVRGHRRTVVRTVRGSGVPCTVANAEGSRTVLVRVEEESGLDRLAPALHASLGVPVVALRLQADAAWGLRLWGLGREVLRYRWPRPGAGTVEDDLSPADAAALVAAAASRPVDGALVALLQDPRTVGDGDARRVAEDARRLVDRLLLDPGPPAVVLVRGDPAGARMTAALVGRTWLSSADPAWTLLVPDDGGVDSAVVLATTLSASAGRRHPTVLLWRSEHGAGYQLWRGDVAFDEHVWGRPPAHLVSGRGAPAVLTEALGCLDARPVEEVLDLAGDPSEALQRLVTVLDLPAACLAGLDDHLGWVRGPDVELVLPATLGAVVSAEMRRDWAGDAGPGTQAAWARARVGGGVFAGCVAVGGSAALLLTPFAEAAGWSPVVLWALVAANAVMAVRLFRAGAAAHRRLAAPGEDPPARGVDP